MKFRRVVPVDQVNVNGLSSTEERQRQHIRSVRKKPFGWKYGSLNFDIMRTKVYKERKKTRCTSFMEWVAFGIVGLSVGLCTAIMTNTEVIIVHEKRLITDQIIGGSESRLFEGWLFFTGLSIFLVFLASAATVYYGPGATGSGNAEVIAYLNGVNYPNLIGFETLVVKIFGVIFAVIGGLCVGKEGPLAHIGANVGAVVPYLPLP